MGREEHRAVQGSALGLHCQEELSGSITAEMGVQCFIQKPCRRSSACGLSIKTAFLCHDDLDKRGMLNSY